MPRWNPDMDAAFEAEKRAAYERGLAVTPQGTTDRCPTCGSDNRDKRTFTRTNGTPIKSCIDTSLRGATRTTQPGGPMTKDDQTDEKFYQQEMCPRCSSPTNRPGAFGPRHDPWSVLCNHDAAPPIGPEDMLARMERAFFEFRNAAVARFGDDWKGEPHVLSAKVSAYFAPLRAEVASLRAELEQQGPVVAAAIALDAAIEVALDRGPDANATTNAATQAFREAVAALGPTPEATP